MSTLWPIDWNIEPLCPNVYKLYQGRRLTAVFRATNCRIEAIKYGEIGELVIPIVEKKLSEGIAP